MRGVYLSATRFLAVLFFKIVIVVVGGSGKTPGKRKACVLTLSAPSFVHACFLPNRSMFIPHKYKHRRKRGASGVPVGSSRKYQSQAVGLVQDMIEWLIDKRMVDYDDESEWRRRSDLEPLPPPKTPGGSGLKPVGVFGGSAGVRSPPPQGIFSAGGGSAGGAADVINLLSDSMDDDDDSFSEDEDF